MRWAGVELRHLLTLEAIVEHGSLAGAARSLGYSQPAVSQQLVTLERLVGAELVERGVGRRQAALTEAGRHVLRHGEAILARARAADADIRALTDGELRTLRLGAFPSAGARIVPTLLRRFAERRPGVAVELVEERSEERLLDRLEAGELDLAFSFAPVRDGPFEAVEVLRDPYVLLVAADSPLAGAGRAVGVRRLARMPLIVCRQSDAADAFARAHGFAAQVRYRVDDNETIVGLAAAGLGAALVPRLAADPDRRDVIQLELAAAPPPRVVVLVRHRDRGPSEASSALTELAVELVGRP